MNISSQINKINAQHSSEDSSEVKLQPQRILWIDVFRVLAIFLILCMHFSAIKFISQSYICAYMTVFFFLLSGYFARMKSWKSWMKRLSLLVVPYIFYNMLMVFLLKFTSMRDHFDLLTTDGWINALFRPANLALWFLFVLIVAQLLIPIFSRCFTPVLAVLTSVLFIYSFYLNMTVEGLSTAFDIVSNFSYREFLYTFSVAFFSLGLLLQRLVNIQVITSTLQRVALPSLCVILPLCILTEMFHDPKQLPAYHFIVKILSIAIIPALSLLICKFLPSIASKIAYFSSGVFFIFVTHLFFGPFIGWFRHYLTIHGFDTANLLIREISPYIVFILCFIAYRAVCRFSSLNYLTMGKN